MLKTILLAMSCLAVATGAQAAAFGIEMGAPLSALKVVKKLDNVGPIQRYSVTVPAPNTTFEDYIVSYTPQTGVCRITGIGVTYNGDATGGKLRSAFEDLSKALQSKYGDSKEFDFLHAGSTWDDPDDFAMALDQDERSLSRFWDREEGSRLPGDLSEIALMSNGLSRSETYLSLRYSFSNAKQCDDARGASDLRGL